MRNSKMLTFLLIWGLIFPQSIIFADEDDVKAQNEKNMEEFLQWQQQFNFYQKNIKPAQDHINALRPEMGPAKYGLACQVPESYPQESIGLCPANPSPMDINQLKAEGKIPFIIEAKSMALQAIPDYKAQKTVTSENIDLGRPSVHHAACLNDQLKEFKARDLDSRLKRLDSLMAKLDDDHEEFLRKNKRNEDFIKRTYNEMYLGKGVDYKRRFNTPACRNIYSPDEFQNMASGSSAGGSGKGLEAVLNKTVDNRKNSDDFLRDRRNIRQDIENSIARAANRADGQGIFGFKDGFDSNFKTGSAIANTTSFQDGISDLQSRVKEYFGKVDRQLKSVLDYDGIDKDIYETLSGISNASGGTEDIEAQFQNWQNRREQKCFNDTFNGGGNQIMQAFDSFDIPGNRTTKSIKSLDQQKLHNYVYTLMKDNDMGIAAKANLFKKFIESNPRYASFRMALGSSFRGRDTNHLWEPTEFFNAVKNECYARMGNKTYGPVPGRKSLKQAIKLVKRMKNSVAIKQRDFKREFANELKARVLTCTNTTTGQIEDKRSCNADSMVVQKDFCYRHARNCAQDTKNCLGKLQEKFDRDRTSLQNKVREHNEALMLQSKAHYNLYKDLRNFYEFEAGIFQDKFKSASFEMPKGIDVSLPEEKDQMKDLEGLKEKLGMGIIDPKDFKDQLKDKLEKLKKSIQKQNDLAYKEVEDYVQKTIESYGHAGDAWQDIYNRCQAVLNAMQVNQQSTGENIFANVPLCDGTGINDVVISDAEQATGIIKTLSGTGILRDEKVSPLAPDYFNNFKYVEQYLKEMRDKITRNSQPKVTKDDDKETTEPNSEYLDTEKEIIRDYCREIEKTIDNDCSLECSDISSQVSLTRNINNCIQPDIVKFFKEVNEKEYEDKICSNNQAGGRWDGKMMTPPFNNTGGDTNIFKTLFNY